MLSFEYYEEDRGLYDCIVTYEVTRYTTTVSRNYHMVGVVEVTIYNNEDGSEIGFFCAE